MSLKSCSRAVVLDAPAHRRVPTSCWTGTQIMLSVTAAQNPFAQARIAAITQLAVFEAVNACEQRYDAYLGTVAAPAGASARAAAIAAAHATLKALLPASGALLDAARLESLAAIRDGQPKFDGIGVGEAAAAAMLASRADDGAQPPATLLPSSTSPGAWQPTPPAFGPGVLLHWQNLTPFGIRSSRQFRSSPPPPLRGGKYRRDYEEGLAGFIHGKQVFPCVLASRHRHTCG
jgi:hypothetical protein